MRFLLEIEKSEPGFVTVSVMYRNICFAERVKVQDRERAAADMIERLYREIAAGYEAKRADGKEKQHEKGEEVDHRRGDEAAGGRDEDGRGQHP